MTPAFKVRALRLFADGPAWVGLAVALETVNGRLQLTEEGDAGYSRAAVDFNPPHADGVVVATENAETVRFAPYLADAKRPVRYWFVATERTGGEILAAGELEKRDGSWPQLLEGDEFVFRRGQLVLEMP